MATRRTPPAREPLSRERVLAAAVELADRHGLDGLTMRKVGDVLAVEAMSLYHHVANKSDLLDGMVDMVFDEFDLPTEPDVPWKDAMRTRCRSARQVLARHPWAVALLESRRSPGPATLRHHDGVLGVLLGSGMSLPLAGHAFALLDSYTYGFALQESVIPVSGPEETAVMATEVFGPEVAATYPHMARFTADYVVTGAYDFAEEFDWGLELVLDGLERAVAAEGRRRRR